MARLSESWFVEGLQDFEYKKYRLLAYLKWVKEQFNNTELYPAFSDLIFHYQNLVAFQKSKGLMEDQFPRNLTGLDLQNHKLRLEELEEDEQLSYVQEIIQYSLPLFKGHLQEGKGIYEFISEHIEIDPVGLLPLNKGEGYFLLKIGTDIKAFEYRVTLFEQANEKYRGLQTSWIANFSLSLVNTFESIKLQLIRSRKELPNPATFAIVPTFDFPEIPSLVPVARRKFMAHLAGFAA